MSAATKVMASPMTGVPVFADTRPIQPGARRSSVSMMATREGTSIVALREVVMAMMAPMITSFVAPNGRYRAAASAIGACAPARREAGKTPNATTDISR